jgi:hypothetical protein
MKYSGRPHYPVLFAFAVVFAVTLTRLSAAPQSYSATPDGGQMPPARVGATAKEAMSPAEYAAMRKSFARSPIAIIDSPNPITAMLHNIAIAEKRSSETLAAIERKQLALQDQLQEMADIQKTVFVDSQRVHDMEERLKALEDYRIRGESMPAVVAGMKTQVDTLVKVTTWAGASLGGLLMTLVGLVFRRVLCASVCSTASLKKVFGGKAA